jgi:L-aminopeptidase/D-esterase-like protein
VVGAVLFDLLVGDPAVRPDAASGYAACVAATGGDVPVGAVGAGAGATIGLWQGLGRGRPAGIGTARARRGGLIVAALVVVNAFGDLRTADRPDWPAAVAAPLGNTTIGVVATNAIVDKLGCFLLAQSAHDGLARALEPAHTTVDGDAMVAAAVGGVPAALDEVRFLAARVVEDAIRSAVR